MENITDTVTNEPTSTKTIEPTTKETKIQPRAGRLTQEMRNKMADELSVLPIMTAQAKTLNAEEKKKRITIRARIWNLRHNAETRAKNQIKSREYAKEYYKKNKDKLKQYQRERYHKLKAEETIAA